MRQKFVGFITPEVVEVGAGSLPSAVAPEPILWGFEDVVFEHGEVLAGNLEVGMLFGIACDGDEFQLVDSSAGTADMAEEHLGIEESGDSFGSGVDAGVVVEEVDEEVHVKFGTLVGDIAGDGGDAAALPVDVAAHYVAHLDVVRPESGAYPVEDLSHHSVVEMVIDLCRDGVGGEVGG